MLTLFNSYKIHNIITNSYLCNTKKQQTNFARKQKDIIFRVTNNRMHYLCNSTLTIGNPFENLSI